MVDVKITPELINDLNSLMNNFRIFMSLNLVHADQGYTGDIQAKIRELVLYSNNNCKRMDIIKTPTAHYITENTDMLSKNLLNITTFLYDYLNYAEPIVKSFLPTRLPRIDSMKTEYTEFMNKYF